MRFKIVHETVVDIDAEWFDEHGDLTHFDNPRMVGGALSLPDRFSRAPADVLKRLMYHPAFRLGQIPKIVDRKVKIVEVKRRPARRNDR